jgi:hypothetical protein
MGCLESGIPIYLVAEIASLFLINPLSCLTSGESILSGFLFFSSLIKGSIFDF